MNGGKGGLLLAAQDLCRPDKKQVLDARLTGHNGKVVNRRVALKPEGCKGYRPPKPKGTVALRRRALVVKLTAGDYTKLRAVRVTLPKGVNVRRLRGKAKTEAARAGSAASASCGPRSRAAAAPRSGSPRAAWRSPAGWSAGGCG